MKKIMLILFLFFLCLSCYLIYNMTEDKKINITAIGDSLANIKEISNQINIKEYNLQFIDKDYRVIDLLDIIEYNKEKTLDDKSISIHNILKNTDILIISIGMNDIYYKLNDNPKEIYTYLNNLMLEYDKLLKEISHYSYQQVYVLGYYSISSSESDLFTYVNYKLQKLSKRYHYEYLDLNKILSNMPQYYEKNDNYYLNNEGKRQVLRLIVEKIKKS